MRIVLFCHSLVSDWNNGNAHFQRGIASELAARGHELCVFEPANGWSFSNLAAEIGRDRALAGFRRAYPSLARRVYDPQSLDLDEALDGADLVIAHEWSEPELLARLGRRRAAGGRFRLLFHDTHHRAITDAAAMARFELGGCDGVLAFGEVLRQIYERRGWARHAWTWHEAADTRVFRPAGALREHDGDVVWIGNWGDEERTRELREFLLEPVGALRLAATVHGVRYPAAALQALAERDIAYRGYLPNHEAPAAFARHRVTVHVPRRPYASALPGIPTIRVFEALACGIPLISAPWDDAEGLFTPGADFLVAADGAAMRRHLADVLADPALAAALARQGLATIRTRHSCAHRVDELMTICRALGVAAATEEGNQACAVV